MENKTAEKYFIVQRLYARYLWRSFHYFYLLYYTAILSSILAMLVDFKNKIRFSASVLMNGIRLHRPEMWHFLLLPWDLTKIVSSLLVSKPWLSVALHVHEKVFDTLMLRNVTLVSVLGTDLVSKHKVTGETSSTYCWYSSYYIQLDSVTGLCTLQ